VIVTATSTRKIRQDAAFPTPGHGVDFAARATDRSVIICASNQGRIRVDTDRQNNGVTTVHWLDDGSVVDRGQARTDA